MKINFVTCLLAIALTGCAGRADYAEVIKTPAPNDLAGVWMSSGPQSAMVSPEAIASLIITRSGDTLDCRQWQRTIVRRGKLYLRKQQFYNVNDKNEDNKIDVSDGVMTFNRLTLRRVDAPTVECQAYLAKVNGDYTILAPAVPVKPVNTSGHKHSGGTQMRNSKS